MSNWQACSTHIINAHLLNASICYHEILPSQQCSSRFLRVISFSNLRNFSAPSSVRAIPNRSAAGRTTFPCNAISFIPVHKELGKKFAVMRNVRINTNLLNVNRVTIFFARLFACLNPSENNSVSAINSLSGALITTGRNSCFRLSGSLKMNLSTLEISSSSNAGLSFASSTVCETILCLLPE